MGQETYTRRVQDRRRREPMKVGDLVMNKYRYSGQMFVVIGVKKSVMQCHIQCIRVEDTFKTRWNNSSTWEIVC